LKRRRFEEKEGERRGDLVIEFMKGRMLKEEM
jgi:hypothetical protein